MVRRRPFAPRRPHRRRRSAPAVPPQIRRALRHARRLQDAADYKEAARIYERLARGAYARQRVRPGIHMDLEAGRCFLESGATKAARRCALRAARRAQGIGQAQLTRSLVEAVAARLDSEDPEAAEAFRTESDALFGTAQTVVAASSHQKRRLPPDCPACHAPLHPDDLTWLEDDRVACPFCGTIVLAE